ncbi:hypothetical protein IM25_06975 [Rhodococcus sp. p52]|nr:hypothetical protein IM25_06975 [Rhodococcus sp. p52]
MYASRTGILHDQHEKLHGRAESDAEHGEPAAQHPDRGVRAEGRQEPQPIAGSATRRSTATNSTAPAAVAAISACV